MSVPLTHNPEPAPINCIATEVNEKIRQQFEFGPYPRVSIDKSPKEDTNATIIPIIWGNHAVDGQPQRVAPTMSLPDVVHRFKSLTTTRYRRG